MHAYDLPPRRPSFSVVPSARAAQETPGGPSATPIYDTLYAEWVKTFRTLPGDRSGEEELGFTAFGHAPHSTGIHHTGTHHGGGHHTGAQHAGAHEPGSGGTGSYASNSYSAYSAGAQSARHSGGPQPGQWQRVGPLARTDNAIGMRPVPAALPPAPRRGV